MRFNSNLGSALLGVAIVSAALPALAAAKHFAKAGKPEMTRANIAANGIIVTGPGWRSKL
jgi:hypothetical protein